ncbi:MAG: hypothetical protein LBT49_05040 [Prevotellaceae bacterium]|jgi:hypothetical protein|nr:hypothetical protein [Prevotellaceae bacterium]
MKKILSIVAVAALLSSCCEKQQPAGVTLEKFFENPAAFVGKDTTFLGKIQAVCDSTGNFVLGTDDTTATQQIFVTPPADAKVCKGCVGKEVFVKGAVSETEEGAYVIEAKCVKGKEACEKKACDGEKKACCKDGEKKACCKDGEKKDCKDGEKKACCKDGEKKACKDGEKKGHDHDHKHGDK